MKEQLLSTGVSERGGRQMGSSSPQEEEDGIRVEEGCVSFMVGRKARRVLIE